MTPPGWGGLANTLLSVGFSALFNSLLNSQPNQPASAPRAQQPQAQPAGPPPPDPLDATPTIDPNTQSFSQKDKCDARRQAKWLSERRDRLERLQTQLTKLGQEEQNLDTYRKALLDVQHRFIVDGLDDLLAVSPAEGIVKSLNPNTPERVKRAFEILRQHHELRAQLHALQTANSLETPKQFTGAMDAAQKYRDLISRAVDQFAPTKAAAAKMIPDIAYGYLSVLQEEAGANQVDTRKWYEYASKFKYAATATVAPALTGVSAGVSTGSAASALTLYRMHQNEKSIFEAVTSTNYGRYGALADYEKQLAAIDALKALYLPIDTNPAVWCSRGLHEGPSAETDLVEVDPDKAGAGLRGLRFDDLKSKIAPKDHPEYICNPEKNPLLKDLGWVKRQIGENSQGKIEVEGPKPVVDRLQQVFDDVKKANPGLYDLLSLEQYTQKPQAGSNEPSFHGCGMAWDVKIDGILQLAESQFKDLSSRNPIECRAYRSIWGPAPTKTQHGQVLKGLLDLAKFFSAHEFMWGAGFSHYDPREATQVRSCGLRGMTLGFDRFDPHHFEVSTALLPKIFPGIKF